MKYLPKRIGNAKPQHVAFVSSQKKEVIINIYKTKKNEFPDMKYKDLIQVVSQISGVGKNTVGSTISEYKNTGLLKSSNKKKNRTFIIQKIDDFEKNAIRRKIYDFWLKREIPTLNKILTAVNTDQDLPNLSLTPLYSLMK
ncbi:uncharacterized protein LOC112690934 [Sipha flava]|uniref:Uncharacterized protein LOC112690934 n=1 Tax=Sipha flava TaxID=143950 RepID=A0A8B8GC86_9HEMI|nr:uncharacterized protein LOC112690934 [Sipha flava]